MEKLIFNNQVWYSIESIAKMLGYWDYCIKYPKDYLAIQEYEFEKKNDTVYYIKKELLVEILNNKQDTCAKAKELLAFVEKNID